MREELADFADSVYAIYRHYRLAGFSDQQAFTLARDFASSLVAQSLKAELAKDDRRLEP